MLLLIFACKRPKYADTGEGGSKIGQILRTSFMNGALVIAVNFQFASFTFMLLYYFI